MREPSEKTVALERVQCNLLARFHFFVEESMKSPMMGIFWSSLPNSDFPCRASCD